MLICVNIPGLHWFSRLRRSCVISEFRRMWHRLPGPGHLSELAPDAGARALGHSGQGADVAGQSAVISALNRLTRRKIPLTRRKSNSVAAFGWVISRLKVRRYGRLN